MVIDVNRWLNENKYIPKIFVFPCTTNDVFKCKNSLIELKYCILCVKKPYIYNYFYTTKT